MATKGLVTGAGGRVGGVGRKVELLRERGLPVRAFVHRDDDRAASLRGAGAEVVVGDLTRVEDATCALDGVRRIYLGLGARPSTSQRPCRRPSWRGASASVKSS